MDEVVNNKKSFTAKLIVLVVSLIVFVASVTYAFFTGGVTETNPGSIDGGAAKFNIESNLETVPVINAQNLSLIAESDVENTAPSVSFTVTNPSATSEISGNYEVYLQNITISRNLIDTAFQWELLKNDVSIATGDFSKLVVNIDTSQDTIDEDGVNRTVVSAENLKLSINNKIAVGSTDQLVFRIWLANDSNVNQNYLTKGSFNGSLVIDARPVKD